MSHIRLIDYKPRVKKKYDAALSAQSIDKLRMALKQNPDLY
jgi:hypothetical protein